MPRCSLNSRAAGVVVAEVVAAAACNVQVENIRFARRPTADRNGLSPHHPLSPPTAHFRLVPLPGGHIVGVLIDVGSAQSSPAMVLATTGVCRNASRVTGDAKTGRWRLRV